MISVALPLLGRTKAWREAARRLASHAIRPEDVQWEGGGLFAHDPLPAKDGPHGVGVCKSFPALAETVLCHMDPEAPALLYAALMRHQTDRYALGNPADSLTRRLDVLSRSVRRDIHKMHAFVRFRELPSDGARRVFGAWFEPDHRIVELAAPFFARRFADMDWVIVTPHGVARFRDGRVETGPPGVKPDLPEDAAETLWGTYFANIFNPSRVKLLAMRSEMSVKYWKNLPETRLIPDMLAQAEGRVAAMRAAMPTTPPTRAARILERQRPEALSDVPATLDEAKRVASGCARCPIGHCATQLVWGEGDPLAPLMIVGEQPGDQEDLAGKPFVGPAGRLLRAVMKEAGVGPAWMTNAVKHFKFTPRGKRRLHQAPTRGEIRHCRWWLDQERALLQPRLTVALGASAAFALTGRTGAHGPRRGRVEQAHDGGPVLITWHPAAILRARDPGPMRQDLRTDLKRAVELLQAV